MPVPERPVLVAPDSFKGTFSAPQVAGAIGRGLERAGLMPPDLCPVADGGEGTLDALLPQLGGELHAVEVQDPLGRPVRAGFGLVEDGGTAIVEMAAASGLGLVAEAERDAWAASTYGTGQLIAAAAEAGAQVILVAVGGSATTDGGAGALEAIADGGGLRGAQIVVLSDVRTVFEDAAKVFGPQKGADPDMVVRLSERLEQLAATLPARPARRADDGRRRRPERRPLGRARRGARAGRAAGCSTRSTSTTACAPRARWSPARASSTSRRSRASSSARSAPAPARRASRCTRSSGPTARRVRQAHHRPPAHARGDRPGGAGSGRRGPRHANSPRAARSRSDQNCVWAFSVRTFERSACENSLPVALKTSKPRWISLP